MITQHYRSNYLSGLQCCTSHTWAKSAFTMNVQLFVLSTWTKPFSLWFATISFSSQTSWTFPVQSVYSERLWSFRSLFYLLQIYSSCLLQASKQYTTWFWLDGPRTWSKYQLKRTQCKRSCHRKRVRRWETGKSCASYSLQRSVNKKIFR